MLLWSDNVWKSYPYLHPLRIDSKDFDPSKRAFPFADTPKVGVLVETEDGHEMRAPELSEHGTAKAMRTRPFIEVGEDYVTFRLQRGPVKERGVNGCQVDDIVKFVADTIGVFNKKFPCRENSLAITKLEEAWLWLQARKMDREARDVEGKSQE